MKHAVTGLRSFNQKHQKLQCLYLDVCSISLNKFESDTSEKIFNLWLALYASLKCMLPGKKRLAQAFFCFFLPSKESRIDSEGQKVTIIPGDLFSTVRWRLACFWVDLIWTTKKSCVKVLLYCRSIVIIAAGTASLRTSIGLSLHLQALRYDA